MKIPPRYTISTLRAILAGILLGLALLVLFVAACAFL